MDLYLPLKLYGCWAQVLDVGSIVSYPKRWATRVVLPSSRSVSLCQTGSSQVLNCLSLPCMKEFLQMSVESAWHEMSVHQSDGDPNHGATSHYMYRTEAEHWGTRTVITVRSLAFYGGGYLIIWIIVTLGCNCTREALFFSDELKPVGCGRLTWTFFLPPPKAWGGATPCENHTFPFSRYAFYYQYGTSGIWNYKIICCTWQWGELELFATPGIVRWWFH